MNSSTVRLRANGLGKVRLIALAAGVLALPAACNPLIWMSPTTATPQVTSSPQITTAPQVISTGVRGTLLAGPTCPVEQAGQSPCVRAVVGATILALDSAGHEVGRAVSDGAGAYFLALPPGSYKIVPQAVQGLMRVPAPAHVTVTTGPPVQLDLEYDTGIR